MRPHAIASYPCPSDAMAQARGQNASVEQLARLNARRKTCGLPELAQYPSDSELREYFLSGENAFYKLIRENMDL